MLFVLAASPTSLAFDTMKYRIVRRAKGWAVQRLGTVITDYGALPGSGALWHTLSIHRFHFIAALRLLILRERARK